MTQESETTKRYANFVTKNSEPYTMTLEKIRTETDNDNRQKQQNRNTEITQKHRVEHYT